MISFSPVLSSSWVLNFPYYYFFPSSCASLTWLGTPPSRPLSSSSHWRSSPSSLLPPPSSPTSARRLPPLPPSLLFSLSLYHSSHPYPLTCCLPACLVSSLLHPLPRCLPLPPSSDFRLLMASPTPLLPPFPLPGRRLLLLSYGPGVGVGVPPPSGVPTSLVNSTAMRVLLPLPLLLMLLPPLGLPLARLPPTPHPPLSACASG